MPTAPFTKDERAAFRTYLSDRTRHYLDTCRSAEADAGRKEVCLLRLQASLLMMATIAPERMDSVQALVHAARGFRAIKRADAELIAQGCIAAAVQRGAIGTTDAHKSETGKLLLDAIGPDVQIFWTEEGIHQAVRAAAHALFHHAVAEGELARQCRVLHAHGLSLSQQMGIETERPLLAEAAESMAFFATAAASLCPTFLEMRSRALFAMLAWKQAEHPLGVRYIEKMIGEIPGKPIPVTPDEVTSLALSFALDVPTWLRAQGFELHEAPATQVLS